MAHLKSAIKRIGTSKLANMRNRARKSAIKTSEKKFRAAVAAKDAEQASALLRECCSLLDKAAKVGVIHGNKASNKKSQLMLVMNGIQA
ncbi:MAG: 30S ribosomal protein S20 [Victivallaceae bacterium]|nr:30S ribosomal protein S20 [Victivallaceae bacterium]